MEEDKQKLREYAALKSQIKQFEKEADKMKPEVLAIIERLNPQEEDHKVSTDFGYFSSVPKRKYTYTIETQVLADKVKAEKKREEQDGTATYEIEPYLKFDAPKGDRANDE